MWLTLALLAVGCGSRAAPEGLVRLRDALDAWDRGVLALDAGRPLDALTAFEEAALGLPDSPELWLWRGKARADAGDMAGAVQAADEALRLHPGWGLALYDRGCWRTRQGRLADASDDVLAALATGEVDLLVAAADPDLDPLRAEPSLAGRVPPRRLPAVVRGPAEPVVVGDRALLTWEVRQPAGAELRLHLTGGLPSALRPVRGVDDVDPQDGAVGRRLELELEAVAPFAGAVGPFHLEAGGLEVTLDAVPVRVLALTGAEPPPGAPGSPWTLPLAGPGWPQAAPGEPAPASLPAGALRWEVRLRGQPDRTVWAGP